MQNNALKQAIQNIYISDDFVFNKHKKFILSLYTQPVLSQHFRMTIREIKNLRNYNQISGIVLSGNFQRYGIAKFNPSQKY